MASAIHIGGDVMSGVGKGYDHISNWIEDQRNIQEEE
jgi:hypothetical protein